MTGSELYKDAAAQVQMMSHVTLYSCNTDASQ